MAESEELTAEIEYCPVSEDHVHCEHWWDGTPCCRCFSNRGRVDGGIDG